MYRTLCIRGVIGTMAARCKSTAASTREINNFVNAAVAFDAPSSSSTDKNELNPKISGEEYRQLHRIKLTGPPGVDNLHPLVTFDDAPFLPKLKQALLKQGYTAPTPTQAQSWPIALKGHDIISIARTGSGKTFGFLIPAIQSLLAQKSEGKVNTDRRRKPLISVRLPRVLVVAPTRELALQIDVEAQKISSLCGIRSIVLYGGSSRGPQIKGLSAGVDIVIGTPGRINDLMALGYFEPDNIDYLVLDEADRYDSCIRSLVTRICMIQYFTLTYYHRMLDMGFGKLIFEIARVCLFMLCLPALSISHVMISCMPPQSDFRDERISYRNF